MKNINIKISLFAAVLLMVSCSEDEVPSPIATATPASQIINSGETTSIALSSTIAGTTFSWTVAQTGVSGATSGSGSTIAQALTASGSVPGTATYTVMPSANGVAGNAITVVITVVITVNLVKTTYLADVKPMLTASCTPCHMAGGTNPNKWDEYAPTKSKINSIIDRVKRDPGATGFMPRNGDKLSADKIAILEKWVADGLLEK